MKTAKEIIKEKLQLLVDNRKGRMPTELEMVCYESAMEEYASQGKGKEGELVEAQQEYIKLLGEELDEVVSMVAVHGWKSSRFEQGKALREKISQLQNK